MSTLTFNTLKFANRLKTAGVPAQQAEAEAEALSEVFEASLSELVTKGDMRFLKNDMQLLKNDMQRLEDRLDTRMAQMKFEILKWVIGIALAQFGLLTGILLKLM